MIDLLWGAGGMLVLLAIAFLVSSDRRAVRPRTVLGALGLQVTFGVVVLYWSVGQRALEAASRAVQTIIDSSREGIGFLFGPVLPEEGQVFAFQVLPVIVFFASLTAVLYHLGILQRVVRVLGGGLGWLLGTEKAESTNAAANIFVGQTEAPLVIRPYVAGLSRSGLFAVMVGGLSTVAGSVLVGYSLLGARLDYLIAASFMAAPGALLMAKIILPEERVDEDEEGSDDDGSSVADPDGDPDGDWASADEILRAEKEAAESKGPADDGMRARNVIDAAANGAADGLKLAATIGAMLLAFISLIALVNLGVSGVGGWFGADDLTIEEILGYVFAPLMTAIGVPWSEAVEAGSFVGQKVVVNEFVAFANLGEVIGGFSDKTAAIVTFALTGFANLGSLGILLGGLGGIAPERRPDIASLGLRAILAATLANLMSAAIAGILIG
ncbi:nucleoside transporter C-terminal domain-containing protein [Nocardioides sp. SOB44]|uniref:Nucleoside transporter C-terminal domain-containing protein n=1 Tax=Nocardioides cremeus TaxID=3058044 RepID=A0ABT8TN27_9ACTN|nr:nucleoside transporter C-terminal domain-containing protein [Nocardioides cremeus]MDO3395362.1 nucleoside transporter C-terminal domain-containing protein [Nocardioides cremeus]